MEKWLYFALWALYSRLLFIPIDMNQSSEELREQESICAKTQNLWGQYKQEPHNMEIRNMLMEQYLPLVRYIAERIHSKLPRCSELDDLISAGVFGLMDAMEKFDLSRGLKFETYCIPRIHGAIIDDLRRWDFAPRLVRSQIKRWQEITERLRSTLGRPATDEEIAEDMGMTIEEYRALEKECRKTYVLSLDGPMDTNHFSENNKNGQNKEQYVHAEIADKKSPDPTDGQELQREFWFQILKGLSIKERILMLLYYREKKTMKKVGEELDLSESRVSQMHSNILRDMRIKFSMHAGTGDYLDQLREEEMLLPPSPPKEKPSSKRKYRKRWKVPQQELESAAQEI